MLRRYGWNVGPGIRAALRCYNGLMSDHKGFVYTKKFDMRCMGQKEAVRWFVNTRLDSSSQISGVSSFGSRTRHIPYKAHYMLCGDVSMFENNFIVGL
jgi:hypothetical protein